MSEEAVPVEPHTENRPPGYYSTRLGVGRRSSKVFIELDSAVIHITPDQADEVADALRRYAVETRLRNK